MLDQLLAPNWFDALARQSLMPGTDSKPQEKPQLFGVDAPPPFVSGPREFKKAP